MRSCHCVTSLSTTKSLLPLALFLCYKKPITLSLSLSLSFCYKKPITSRTLFMLQKAYYSLSLSLSTALKAPLPIFLYLLFTHSKTYFLIRQTLKGCSNGTFEPKIICNLLFFSSSSFLCEINMLSSIRF